MNDHLSKPLLYEVKIDRNYIIWNNRYEINVSVSIQVINYGGKPFNKIVKS